MNLNGLCGEENIEELGQYHYICDKTKRGAFGCKEPIFICDGCNFACKSKDKEQEEKNKEEITEEPDKTIKRLCDMVANLTSELYHAKNDIGALLFLNGNCEYCANGQVEKYCGAERWTCKIGDSSNCRPVWRGVVKESEEE